MQIRFNYIYWGIIGLLAPVLMAVHAVPVLMSKMGSYKFGFLALAWGLIGYASSLDLGVGRALTQRIADLRRSNRSLSDAIYTAVCITLGLSLFFSFAILIFNQMDVRNILRIDDTIKDDEIHNSILIMALAMPMQALSAVYRGVNEAFLKFKGINILRIILGVANFGAPLLILELSLRLDVMILSLGMSRLIGLIVYRWMALKCFSEKKTAMFCFNEAKELFAFGKWVTISSLISPVMVQSDRFFIAFLIGATAVTTYVIPYEMVMQGLIVAGAVSSVAYPIIAKMDPLDKNKNWEVIKIWSIRLGLVVGVLMLILFFSSEYILKWWIGDGVSSEAGTIAKWLCVGVFFNSIATIYYSFLHANKHVKITAIIHICELPIYIFALVVFLNYFGVIGAAVVWSIRAVLDLFAMFYASRKILQFE